MTSIFLIVLTCVFVYMRMNVATFEPVVLLLSRLLSESEAGLRQLLHTQDNVLRL